ncbi:hypothetical protein AM571_CH02310 [Rhizobium etli 8C-3]|uniref:Uncharacterized protein n=1 Tax=Rhizobium etli 8C-3 TaxID=538025 RepID=A0A1L5P4R3_RHIET|nr:hypothetical protein [Rhizobium etli]APO75119.1 hypothetical protein AM571_CH02310 [Rhizobium etli 8C-3]
MKLAVAREIKSIAAEAGADSWKLIREGKHLIIDFRFAEKTVRQVLAATPSGPRARRNEVAWLRRQVAA